MGSIMVGVDSTCSVPVDFAERENNPLNEAVQMSAVPRAIPAGSRSDSSPIFSTCASIRLLASSGSMSIYIDHKRRFYSQIKASLR